MDSKTNDAESASGTITADGMFVVPDAPLGTVSISIDTERLKLGPNAKNYVKIPDRYAIASESGLSYEIKTDGNEPIVLNLE